MRVIINDNFPIGSLKEVVNSNDPDIRRAIVERMNGMFIDDELSKKLLDTSNVELDWNFVWFLNEFCKSNASQKYIEEAKTLVDKIRNDQQQN